jgi:D-alanyl-D-alanine carboxypeptidase
VILTRSTRSFLAALVLALGFVSGVVPLSGAAPVYAAPLPPPTCRFDDVLTRHRDYADWNHSLLDTTYMIPKGYVPPNLVSTSNAGIRGGGKVRGFVIADLADMARAARISHAGLRVVSAYRSWSTQKVLFNREVDRVGYNRARYQVARPGHSEHQLGTTIDFGAAGGSGGVSQTFANTAAGQWIKQNGWKYGWIMSYPRNKTNKTCYYSEPWHFRYVGRAMAANVHASGLTLREYIWLHYE